MNHPAWIDNAIQFPRLLAEIVATQQLDLQALATSMDLSADQVQELLTRATTAWEDLQTDPAPRVMLDLSVFNEDGSVSGMATWDLSTLTISDVVCHASQLAVVRRAGGDIEPILDELDEALESANLLEPSI